VTKARILRQRLLHLLQPVLLAHQDLKVMYLVQIIVKYVQIVTWGKYPKLVLLFVQVANVDNIHLSQVNLSVQNVSLEGMASISHLPTLQQFLVHYVQLDGNVQMKTRI
jgi:hypothetical protein